MSKGRVENSLNSACQEIDPCSAVFPLAHIVSLFSYSNVPSPRIIGLRERLQRERGQGQAAQAQPRPQQPQVQTASQQPQETQQHQYGTQQLKDTPQGQSQARQKVTVEQPKNMEQSQATQQFGPRQKVVTEQPQGAQRPRGTQQGQRQPRPKMTIVQPQRQVQITPPQQSEKESSPEKKLSSSEEEHREQGPKERPAKISSAAGRTRTTKKVQSQKDWEALDSQARFSAEEIRRVQDITNKKWQEAHIRGDRHAKEARAEDLKRLDSIARDADPDTYFEGVKRNSNIRSDNVDRIKYSGQSFLQKSHQVTDEAAQMIGLQSARLRKEQWERARGSRVGTSRHHAPIPAEQNESPRGSEWEQKQMQERKVAQQAFLEQQQQEREREELEKAHYGHPKSSKSKLKKKEEREALQRAMIEQHDRQLGITPGASLQRPRPPVQPNRESVQEPQYVPPVGTVRPRGDKRREREAAQQALIEKHRQQQQGGTGAESPRYSSLHNPTETMLETRHEEDEAARQEQERETRWRQEMARQYQRQQDEQARKHQEHWRWDHPYGPPPTQWARPYGPPRPQLVGGPSFTPPQKRPNPDALTPDQMRLMHEVDPVPYENPLLMDSFNRGNHAFKFDQEFQQAYDQGKQIQRPHEDLEPGQQGSPLQSSQKHRSSQKQSQSQSQSSANKVSQGQGKRFKPLDDSEVDLDELHQHIEKMQRPSPTQSQQSSENKGYKPISDSQVSLNMLHEHNRNILRAQSPEPEVESTPQLATNQMAVDRSHPTASREQQEIQPQPLSGSPQDGDRQSRSSQRSRGTRSREQSDEGSEEPSGSPYVPPARYRSSSSDDSPYGQVRGGRGRWGRGGRRGGGGGGFQRRAAPREGGGRPGNVGGRYASQAYLRPHYADDAFPSHGYQSQGYYTNHDEYDSPRAERDYYTNHGKDQSRLPRSNRGGGLDDGFDSPSWYRPPSRDKYDIN